MKNPDMNEGKEKAVKRPEPKFRFTKKDKRLMRSFPYQIWRAIILGLHFWKLVRKVH
jgi:hypothetical protein